MLSFRNCEIVQQLDYIDMNNVMYQLDTNPKIQKYAYIIHDKDKDDTGALKKPHIHLILNFNSSYKASTIANWFKIKDNYICKIKGRFSDALKYLTHQNAPDKHQYNENDVISNFDFKSVIDKSNSNKRLDEIVNGIVEGDIREYNYFDKITGQEYVKYKRQIDNAFNYRKDKIRGSERNMKCIYIMGDSGTGKTTYAKEIAYNNHYSCYVSSGSNDVLDDYKGEDCIILDDLRPSCLGLSDLLKMLDNNTASTVKSRYKNKVLECKMIIITTVLDIDTFFSNVFKEDKETVIQLKRRCTTLVTMTEKNIAVQMWLQKSRCYGKRYVFPNTVLAQYKVHDLTDDEAIEQMQNILGVTDEVLKDMKTNPEEYKIDDDVDVVDSDKNNPFN